MSVNDMFYTTTNPLEPIHTLSLMTIDPGGSHEKQSPSLARTLRRRHDRGRRRYVGGGDQVASSLNRPSKAVIDYDVRWPSVGQRSRGCASTSGPGATVCQRRL